MSWGLTNEAQQDYVQDGHLGLNEKDEDWH